MSSPEEAVGAPVEEGVAAPAADTAEVPAADGASPPTAPKGDAKPDAEKKDEVVYDDPKAVPKVPKPNEGEFKKNVQEHQAEITIINSKINAIKEKIDVLSLKRKSQREEGSGARTLFHSIKTEKDRARAELNALYDADKKARERRIKKAEDAKKMRATMKYTSTKQIDDAIGALRREQETSTLSLKEEKDLIKRMGELTSQRKRVAEYEKSKDKPADVGVDVDDRKAMEAKIKEKKEELGKITARLNAQYEILTKDEPSRKKEGDQIPALIAERKKLFATLKEKRDNLRKIHDEYYTARRARQTYEYQVRQAKKRQYESRVAEERRTAAETEKAIEEEEASQKPWLAEIALIDVLSAYFKKFDEEDKKEDSTAAPTAKTTTVGGKKVRRSKRDEDESFFTGGGAGGGKKKGKGKRKKQVAKFVVTPMIIEELTHVGVKTPVSAEDVPATLKSLAERRAYYDTAPPAPKKGKKAAKAAEAKAPKDAAEGAAAPSEE